MVNAFRIHWYRFVVVLDAFLIVESMKRMAIIEMNYFKKFITIPSVTIPSVTDKKNINCAHNK